MRACVYVCTHWAYDNRQTDGHSVDPLLVKGSREQDTSWGEITAERDRTDEWADRETEMDGYSQENGQRFSKLRHELKTNHKAMQSARQYMTKKYQTCGRFFISNNG